MDWHGGEASYQYLVMIQAPIERLHEGNAARQRITRIAWWPSPPAKLDGYRSKLIRVGVASAGLRENSNAASKPSGTRSSRRCDHPTR